MKDRYLFFKNFPYFDGIISTYDNINYKKICSVKKNIYLSRIYLIKNFKKKKKKKKLIFFLLAKLINIEKKYFLK